MLTNLSKRLMQSRRLHRVGGYLLSTLAGRWMETLDYRVAYYDPSADVGRIEYNEPVIYLVWHEYLTLPFFVRRGTKLALLTSRHRDAEFLTQAAEMSGFRCFRGSSGRGGGGALLGILKESHLNGLVITPDGPRGPRRKIAIGPVFLASRLQYPIVLIGAGFDRPVRNNRAWDKFAIPRFHSRARMILSPKIYLQPEMNRSQLESVRASLGRSLANITLAAERWAASNRPHENSAAFYPGPFACDSRISFRNSETDVGL